MNATPYYSKESIYVAFTLYFDGVQSCTCNFGTFMRGEFFAHFTMFLFLMTIAS